MPATKAPKKPKAEQPDRELVFDRPVGIAGGGCVLQIGVETWGDDEANEVIVGEVSAGEEFGTWLDPEVSEIDRDEPLPTEADICQAVSEALGFKVEFQPGTPEWSEAGFPTTFRFRRASDEPAPPAEPTKPEPAKPPPEPPPKPVETPEPARPAAEDEELRQLREWRKAVAAQREVWKEAEAKADASKAIAKEDREAADAEEVKLLNMTEPPGPPKPDAWETGLGKVSKNGQPEAKPTEDESWRGISLEAAFPNVKMSVIDKLHEAEIQTIGQLTDYCDAKGKAGHAQPLITIPGIGAAKAEQILQATEEFWARRNAQAKPSEHETIPVETVTNGEPDETSAAEPATKAAAEDTTWRDLTLYQVLTGTDAAAAAAALYAAGINTLGQLVDWMDSGKPLTELKGIGKAKAAAVAAAVGVFFIQRRKPAEVAK